jgi:mannose-1-phosphate guanylyltransferase
VRAKPAIPVAGNPLVRRIVGWLAGQGVQDVVLNLHYRPETIARVLGDGSDLAACVRYSWEQPELLGAAGGPRQALSIIGADTFFLINGDTLTNVDLASVAESHQSSGARVTLAVVPNRRPDRYGGVRLDAGRRVTGFVPRGAAEASYHFIGVQAVDATAFATLPPGRAAHSIGGLYDRLIAEQPGSILGFVCDAAFWDVGTVADYWATSRSFADAEGAGDVVFSRRGRIDPTARIARSILWDEVEISSGCVLDECIITDGVRLPRDTTYRRAILIRQPDGAARAELFSP